MVAICNVLSLKVDSHGELISRTSPRISSGVRRSADRSAGLPGHDIHTTDKSAHDGAPQVHEEKRRAWSGRGMLVKRQTGTRWKHGEERSMWFGLHDEGALSKGRWKGSEASSRRPPAAKLCF